MPSFNLDVTGMLNMAASIFNGLGPLFFVIAGISIGVGLLMKIVDELRKAF
jgi:hypothetical protein